MEKPPGEAREIDARMIEQLRVRNYVLCLYGGGVYGFVHRTFLEFFCAAHWVQRFEKEGLPFEDLKRDLFEKHWQDPACQEVLRLVCGGIGAVHAKKLIRYLGFQAEPAGPLVILRKRPTALCLAIQCLGEVRPQDVVEEEGRDLIDLTARLLSLLPKDAWKLSEDQRTAVVEIENVARSTGSRWAGRRRLAETLRTRLAGLGAGHAKACWLRLAGGVLAGLPNDAGTLPLLRERAEKDENSAVRSAALQALAAGWLDYADRVVLSKDLDGVPPFLDPIVPISSEHVSHAARRLGRSVEQVRDRLAALAPTLGWNPLAGAARSRARAT
ncbi:MAG: hypothetical protein HY744_04880 [Deltaproteobacteria bacterium]|nr:hypothetical protein [Deltaproteobacteria bacterium]